MIGRFTFLSTSILAVLFIFFGCNRRQKASTYIVDGNKYTHKVGYIDPAKALLNHGFKVCDENKIYQYYNPKAATFSKGKNGLRKIITQHYQNSGYTDSGYLTIRFVINCEGEAGRYIIHENDLDLNPTKLDPQMVEHLFELTSQLKKWNPNIIKGEPKDSYMFITYRIENGKIVEILP